MNTPRFPRVYLAGPDLFFRDAQERYAALKVACAQHALRGIAPTDAQTDLVVEPNREGARRIYRADIALLRSCDGVLANVTPFRGEEPDSGTAYEMGYAAALGLPVVAYCLDGLDTRERTRRGGHLPPVDELDDGRDVRGLLIEDFGLYTNLMLCAEHETFATIEPAAQALARQLRKKSGA
jgi:nucleoside 2-deoxyribosyltransferase